MASEPAPTLHTVFLQFCISKLFYWGIADRSFRFNYNTTRRVCTDLYKQFRFVPVKVTALSQ